MREERLNQFKEGYQANGFELIVRNEIYMIFKGLDLVSYGKEDGIIHTTQYDDLSDLEKKRLEYLSAKMSGSLVYEAVYTP